MLLPLHAQAPTLQAPPVGPEPGYTQAEAELLDHMDLGEPFGAEPLLSGRDQLAYRWLKAAATWKPGRVPVEAFPPATLEHREAEAMRAFLAGPLPSLAQIDKMSLRLGGSRLLLWRWMKARKPRLAAPLRRAVEDRLAAQGADILRGWALRQALCFALAERDSARFGQLKQSYGAQSRDLFAGFQSLFAMLDGPSPVLRIWQLPGLEYQDSGLGDLGASRVWVAPFEAPPPEGAAWIIPSATGLMGARDSQLPDKLKAEAQELSKRLEGMGRKAFFAASAQEWERQGLSFFPILLQLDAEKRITGIQMGDAAPGRP